MKKIKVLALTLVGIFAFTACKKEVKESKEEISETQVSKEVKNTKSDSVKNKIDWKGEYFGVLPCADCPGIETTIKLNEDGTFENFSKYQESKEEIITEKGTFSWSEDKTKIIIGTDTYLLGEGQIVMLNKEGNAVVGDLADKYVLKKK